MMHTVTVARALRPAVWGRTQTVADYLIAIARTAPPTVGYAPMFSDGGSDSPRLRGSVRYIGLAPDLLPPSHRNKKGGARTSNRSAAGYEVVAWEAESTAS